MAPKAFTVEEANALIPLLEDTLDRVEEKKAVARKYEEKLQILDALWGDKLTAPTNPDHQESLQHRQMLSAIIQDIHHLVHQEILVLGLRFPAGGLEHGLIDFPTTFKGRWVYLCWQRGESEVRYWHEIDSGYSGRQEIAAEHIITMGKEDDPELLDSSGLDF